MNKEKQIIRKLFFKLPEKNEKWMVSIRFPKGVKNKVRDLANIYYKGRGKQSILIEDAVKYYLYTLKDIKWFDYQRDYDYAELLDDIREGINQESLDNASQIFFSMDTKNKILDLEQKIKLLNPLMNDVRVGLIRKAVSIRLSIEDKAFFDEIMIGI
jgi:hypothetical protein